MGHLRICRILLSNLTRHQCRINGLTHINLTKLDVLSELETIQLGVGYKIDGKEISAVPSLIEDFERTEVLYETLPGWKQDISKVSPIFIPSSPYDFNAHISA